MINVFAVPLVGSVAGRIMARANRDAEREAIDILAPEPRDAVLVVGFGPGVGIELLVPRVAHGWIGGADPSRPMLRAAARRNRHAVARGQLHLAARTAAALPWGDATFDGALAVNAIQFFEPPDPSLADIARVLRPGARLVTLTHDWALRQGHATLDAWWADLTPRLSAAGFTDLRRWQARAEDGKAVAMAATRAG